MGIYEVPGLAEKPGRPVGTMRLRSLLTVNDRWMMAKVDKYETETSYWLNKLDNEIQESKGDIARERKQK